MTEYAAQLNTTHSVKQRLKLVCRALLSEFQRAALCRLDALRIYISGCPVVDLGRRSGDALSLPRRSLSYISNANFG